MERWVDVEILQVRQLQSFNPSLFSRKPVMAELLSSDSDLKMCFFVLFLNFQEREVGARSTTYTSKCRRLGDGKHCWSFILKAQQQRT